MQPRIGPREIVYENQHQAIHRVLVQFDNFSKEIFVNVFGCRAGVVITRGEEILLVRQYRLLANGLSWEIPGGKVDAGETPEAAAHREALEEAGGRCTHLQPLLYFHPGLDTCDNPTFIFVGEEFIPEIDSADAAAQHEITERAWIRLDECLRMIFAREIIDSLTVSALLAVFARRTRPGLIAG